MMLGAAVAPGRATLDDGGHDLRAAGQRTLRPIHDALQSRTTRHRAAANDGRYRSR
ncbi:hypothetical protein TOK_2358 [Pseudonocardia sp. N23]|nr:hypothetical protein TOK_2358 [Pseudonocardia sp. N23]